MIGLVANGWELLRTRLTKDDLDSLRRSIFYSGGPGQRCLLDHPLVKLTATTLRAELIEAKVLPERSVAIQAIAFDKSPASNWKVTWHQDVMFPFARPATASGYDLVSIKEGIDYARPPQTVLDEMLAVRLHLDDCDETNGPLRVAPGSHREGVFKSTDISAAVERFGDVTCLARTGEVVAMKPLLLHASSRASAPKHRRVLHLVYHSGEAITEPWHRSV